MRLHEEDPTLVLARNAETHQNILSGMGDLHLDITLERLKRKFGVEAVLDKPRIPYRETIRAESDQQGKYKKQTGGRGQYGDVWLRVSPRARGEGFQFVDKIVGGAVPRQYIPAVEKGVRETMEHGVVAGYPVVDVEVALHDGSYHAVDSSEMAFKIAAGMAFKKAFQEAQPCLLEPIMRVSVRSPNDFAGDVIGDLSSRRGKVQGMNPDDHDQTISALVPLGELATYSVELRSLTRGRGSYSIEFQSYEEVPPDAAQKIIAAHKPETAD